MRKYEEQFIKKEEAQEFIFEELIDAEDVNVTSIELVKVFEGFLVIWEEV